MTTITPTEFQRRNTEAVRRMRKCEFGIVTLFAAWVAVLFISIDPVTVALSVVLVASLLYYLLFVLSLDEWRQEQMTEDERLALMQERTARR